MFMSENVRLKLSHFVNYMDLMQKKYIYKKKREMRHFYLFFCNFTLAQFVFIFCCELTPLTPSTRVVPLKQSVSCKVLKLP